MPVTATAYTDDDFVDQYDDFGDEEGGDDMSSEDRAAMAQGTTQVQQALGNDASKVTVVQIQKALWHYYYDAEKSAAYLRRTFISPPPKAPPKKAPEGKSGQLFLYDTLGLFARAAGADRGPAVSIRGRGYGGAQVGTPFLTGHEIKRRPVPLRSEFDDMPWLNVPHHRQAVLLPPPRPRGGGLLGGGEAPKMSKLQALAAARKKKAEDKKGQERTAQVEGSMKRMSITEGPSKESTDSSPNPAKRQKNTEKDTLEPRQTETSSQSTAISQTKQLDARRDDVAAQQTSLASPSPPAVVQVSVARSSPSAFAQTLCGSAPDARRANRPDVFAMPYASSPAFRAEAFSEPSPDDIVLAAQAKAGKKAAPTPKAAKKMQSGGAPKPAEGTDVASGISNLKVADIPPPRSKGLDVVEEFEKSSSKRSTSFVVVGHVDAGKSTLMGRLLLELKFVEQRTVDKYRRQAEKSGKQSFALAWVMDQGSEERDRGVTIDIATNHFETPTTKFTILDAPGHRDFVPNMIAGASQADFAILVIDANTGAYEKGLKGQTREHVLLLRSLGVQRLVVAVNKLDMVTWSQDRFNEISEQVSGFLTGLGFQDKFVSFIPISGLNGDNIAKKIEDPAASWYAGPTLTEGLEQSVPTANRALKKPFRMAISEVFRSQQGTTTLAGRVDSGTFQVGDSVLVQPSGESAYIKSIMVDDEAQDWAVAGQSVTLALANIDSVHIRVGDIVCEAKKPILCGDTFTMKAMAFDHVWPMPVDLHRGRLHAPGRIQSIAATLDKATGEVIKNRPKIVQPGSVARLVVKLDSKVPLEAGQRVVIRSGGETTAAGLLE